MRWIVALCAAGGSVCVPYVLHQPLHYRSPMQDVSTYGGETTPGSMDPGPQYYIRPMPVPEPRPVRVAVRPRPRLIYITPQNIKRVRLVQEVHHEKRAPAKFQERAVSPAPALAERQSVQEVADR